MNLTNLANYKTNRFNFKSRCDIMKILFFIDSISGGGKERRLAELIKVLVLKKDIEFELVLMSEVIHYKEVLDLNINIHYILRKTKKDLSVFSSFFKLCKNYQPDIVHCWDSMTAFYSVLACKLLNIKLVNGMVTDSPQQQNYLNKHWLRARLTFPFSDVIVGNSKAGLVAYHAPSAKSVVIHNGYNFERSDNLLKSSILRNQINIATKYIVGMVANFSERKDYATYFSAAQILLKKRKDITFVAIGYNTDSDESKALINNEFLEYFRLLGKRSDIESLVNLMDIGVLSTFTEGISNAILEYMSLSKPVIATSGGGTNEIVIDNLTGFLIGPSNPEELATKLEILLNNNSLSTSMGLAGKERILNEFSIDKMVKQYISIYEEILLHQ